MRKAISRLMHVHTEDQVLITNSQSPYVMALYVRSIDGWRYDTAGLWIPSFIIFFLDIRQLFMSWNQV